MAAGLLGRLEARVTFVVGKGGVGKTTTAGGLAVALADGGTETHLLSTDPAHSIGDLFGITLSHEPATSPCSDRLVLEEPDAREVAARRLDALGPALRQLMDRGTYLAEEDADALLDAALPGLDEVGAALRIGALHAPRLVVDTAPTGHTIRLLDTPEVVRGWLQVFDAMAAKADAVASALLGRDVRLPAEAELETLAREIETFERVIREADFVVVTGPGRTVVEETERLVAGLRERGLRVAAVVGPDLPGVVADLRLPFRPGVEGCRELRSWWKTGEGAAVEPARETPRRPASGEAPAAPEEEAGPLPPELDRSMLLFAGKGGVGKSTCAAAVAVRLAASGASVVLLGADPAGAIEETLAGQEVEGLVVRQLDAERELERLRVQYREEVETVFEAVGLNRSARLDRAVIESLWRLAPPGVDELMAVARVAQDLEAGVRLVIDTAPTGHFLRLVTMPDLALDWIRRIMEILLKYGTMAELDAPARQLLRFARRVRRLRERLADPGETAIVVVTLDEPMVRAETNRLVTRLEELGMPASAVVVNQAVGPARSWPGVPTWRAPRVPDATGADGLESLMRAWERLN